MEEKEYKNGTIKDFYLKFFQIREGMTMSEVAGLLTDAHMENCSYTTEPDGKVRWTFYKGGWHTGYIIVFSNKKVIFVLDDKNLQPGK